MKSPLQGLFAALLVCATLSPTLVQSQPNYPVKPVRVILPYPAGGVLDAIVRALAQQLQSRMGQSFFVDNQPGGSGVIGLGNCQRAAPDGYTICITTNDTISINPFLLKGTKFDPRELSPIQRLVSINGVIYATADSRFQSFQHMMGTAAAKPGTVAWGSFGTGSSGHLYMAWLGKERGVDFLHVPYKGSAPLLQAALAGEHSVGMLASGILTQHIKTGKIVPLAVLGNQRLVQFPNVPSLGEMGIKFSIETWFGAFGPPGTPRAVMDRLNQELTMIIQDPTFRKEFVEPQGLLPATMSVDQFVEFLKADRTQGELLVKMTGVQID